MLLPIMGGDLYVDEISDSGRQKLIGVRLLIDCNDWRCVGKYVAYCG